MAGYNILRAVSFNNQVMNIIFEVSRTLWNRICWNCTKWIQIDFDVSLVHWLDSRLKRGEAKATNYKQDGTKLVKYCLAGAWGGLFIQMRLSWSLSGSKYDFVAFIRHWEEITVLGGSHCTEHRNEMVLYYHYSGIALGAMILCFAQCFKLLLPQVWSLRQEPGIWDLVRNVESQFPPQSIQFCILTKTPPVIFACTLVLEALLGLFRIVLNDLIFWPFSEMQGIVLIS